MKSANCKAHILPKQIEENGLTKNEVSFDIHSLKELIRSILERQELETLKEKLQMF